MTVNNNHRFDTFPSLNMYMSIGFYSNQVLEVETSMSTHIFKSSTWAQHRSQFTPCSPFRGMMWFVETTLEI